MWVLWSLPATGVREDLHHGTAVPWRVVTMKGAQVPKNSNLGAHTATGVWGQGEAKIVYRFKNINKNGASWRKTMQKKMTRSILHGLPRWSKFSYQ